MLKSEESDIVLTQHTHFWKGGCSYAPEGGAKQDVYRMVH